MKVFCKNCKVGKKHLICKVSCEFAIKIIMKEPGFNPDKLFYVPDEFESCDHYKRKWWKFWVKA